MRKKASNFTNTISWVAATPATHDTMDPKAMEEQSTGAKGRYLHCPNGSHFAMWDDQKVFMEGVIKFIKDVDSGSL